MRLDHLLSKETSSNQVVACNVLRSEFLVCLKVALFNLEGICHKRWGYSSAGRAPALQAGGHRFDPDYLHHLERQAQIEVFCKEHFNLLLKKKVSKENFIPERIEVF